LILHDRSQIGYTPLAGLESLLDHPLRPYPETLDQPSGNAIGHISIHKAKGLDALAVILVGVPASTNSPAPTTDSPTSWVPAVRGSCSPAFISRMCRQHHRKTEAQKDNATGKVCAALTR
jgi:hypothetical protein